jgi:hypothetical protein
LIRLFNVYYPTRVLLLLAGEGVLVFAAFALALAHGAGAGTDTAAGWARFLYAGTGLVAFNMLVFRALKGGARAGKPGERAAAGMPAAPRGAEYPGQQV